MFQDSTDYAWLAEKHRRDLFYSVSQAYVDADERDCAPAGNEVVGRDDAAHYEGVDDQSDSASDDSFVPNETIRGPERPGNSVQDMSEMALQQFQASKIVFGEHVRAGHEEEWRALTAGRDPKVSFLACFEHVSVEKWINGLRERQPIAFRALQLSLGGVRSSAYVERMFSTSKIVWNKRTKMMRPEKFEMKVLLRQNGRLMKERVWPAASLTSSNTTASSNANASNS
jgi:hypothetical protein